MWKLATSSKNTVTSLQRTMFSTTSVAHWDKNVDTNRSYLFGYLKLFNK